MSAKLIVSLLLLLVIAIFSAQNYAQTEVRFLFWSTSISLAIALFLSFAIGALIGSLLCLARRRQSEKNEED